MADPVRVQVVQAGLDAGRPGQLPAVRDQFAATITPMPTPVAAVASAAASRTSSIMSVMPPNRPAYPDGSTWISSQPEPSARSSCAVSVSSRRTSSGPRSTERAVSYSRWNRNQPRSSVPLSRGGQSSVSAAGSRMPRSRASSTSVPCRIDPVKCRCRCALGRVLTGRGMASSLALLATPR